MMKTRLGAILGLILLAAVPVRAQNYTVRGGMGAEIRAAGIPARISARTVK
jgi:hypothetical protein